MTRMNRRKLLGTMMAGAGGVAASSMLGMPAFAQENRIRHFWWGNPSRDERTYKVIELFNASSDVQVSGETIGWGDYWTKMATQTAGGNMADLVQMDYRYLFEYVRRGALKSLQPHIGNGLDLSTFDQSALNGGMVDGELYALNIGSNSQVCMYNTALVEAAGEEFDPINWTYDDLKRVATAITENTGSLGTDDLSLHNVGFENFVRQNGYERFTDDGQLAFGADVLEEWWAMWADMRAAGLTPSAETTVGLEGSGMADLGIVTKSTAMSYLWSNQVVGVQALMEDTVGAAMYPHLAGGKPGQFIKPSMFMCVTRDTVNEEAAIAYMNNWVNGEEATSILSLERGIPASSVVRARLEPSFTPAEQASVNYFNAIQDNVGELPPPPPKGAGEAGDAFVRVGTEAILGNASISDAAASYIDEANSILFRAA